VRDRFAADAIVATLTLATGRRLLASWPNLQTFELVGVVVRLDAHALKNQVHPRSSKLKRLKLNVLTPPVTLFALLPSLPRTLTHLEIDLNALFEMERRAIMLPLAIGMPQQLSELTLLDTPREDAGEFAHHGLSRGGWDLLLRRLINAKRLTVSPVALSNLQKILGGLTELRELALHEGRAEAPNAVSSDEVVEYLSRQAGLQKLAVNHRIWRRWTLEGCEAVDDMADKKGVHFTYLG
jgi:hypothetical protein